MLWANEISVSVLETSFSFIVAKVQLGPAAKPWLIFAAYGDCDDRRNDEIWRKLSDYATNNDLPVCAIGDFNCITGQNEKQGGSQIVKAKHKKFRSFLQRAGLIDLGFSGPAYTWANNQQGMALILERLDRAVVTAEWINLYPNSKVFHIPNYSSDHLPILLRTEPKPRRKAKSFRVKQWWASHHDFQDVCAKASQNGGQSWSQLCDSFRNEVLVWGKGSKNPDWELVNIEKEMEQLITQQQTDVIRERIAILQREHSRCIAAQESYWLQRSRLNWNLMGDQNTRFFHMTAVVRRRRNRIQAIQTAEGDWIVKEDQIRKLFVNHYKVIYKKDPQEISIPIRQFVDSIEGEIIKIPQVQMEGLERNPTPTEILWAVNALGPMKLPGPDGINAALIQQQWKHFGPTIIREV